VATAVANVHYHCDISCNLAIGQARLQGCFLQTDIKTLIKFHVLLGKSALECYGSLKEGLGTHSSSYKTVYQWVNAIKTGQEETGNAPHSGAPTLAKDEYHVEQVKYVLESTWSIHAWQLLQKSESLQHLFTLSSPRAWGKEKLVQNGFHTCSTMTQEP
jgi:transposase